MDKLKKYRAKELSELNKFSPGELKKIVRVLKRDFREYFKGSSKWDKDETIIKVLDKYTLAHERLYSQGFAVPLKDIFIVRGKRLQREGKKEEKRGKIEDAKNKAIEEVKTGPKEDITIHKIKKLIKKHLKENNKTM